VHYMRHRTTSTEADLHAILAKPRPVAWSDAGARHLEPHSPRPSTPRTPPPPRPPRRHPTNITSSPAPIATIQPDGFLNDFGLRSLIAKPRAGQPMRDRRGRLVGKFSYLRRPSRSCDRQGPDHARRCTQLLRPVLPCLTGPPAVREHREGAMRPDTASSVNEPRRASASCATDVPPGRSTAG